MLTKVAQTWDAETYATNARFVADLGGPLVELLAPRSFERILDVGCGDGALTAKIAARSARVVGVDASADLVRAARALGIDARVHDAHELEFDEEFDGVISNAALHWMKRPDAVIDGVYRALRGGGRFVGEMGGKGCVSTFVSAAERSLARRGIHARALSPWYFPSAEEYGERLTRRGFVVKSASLFDRPTPLPTGVRGWLATFGGAYLSAVPEAERRVVVTEIDDEVRPILSDANGVVVADYVRVRFVAEKPM